MIKCNINCNTNFKTYPYNAYYIGALEANNIDISDMLINDYFDIYCYNKHGNIKLDFRNSGKLMLNRFKLNYFNIDNITVDSLFKYIEQGYLIFVLLNEKYISNSEIHSKHDYNHDWLIYGFDNQRKNFLCLGFTGNSRIRVYKSILLNSDEVFNAMKHVSKSYLKTHDKSFRNHTFSINPYWTEYKCTQFELLEKLNIFFHGKKMLKHDFLKNIKANKHAINRFLTYFYKQYVKKNKPGWLYIENFSILYEHKLVLFELLKKLEINNKDYMLIEDIIKQQHFCLSLSVKFNITKNKKICSKIYSILCQIEKNTVNLIDEILEQNKKKTK